MGMLLLEDKLTKVFNEIVKFVPNEYGSYDEEENCEPVWDALYAAGCGNRSNVSSGASKVCAIIDGCSSVLKVPYAGCWYVNYEEEIDEETGEILQEEEEYFEEFSGAENSNNNSWDYCLSEYEIYRDAVEYGVEVFFPKTELFGYCKSGAVIKQEKVNGMWDVKRREPSKASMKKVKENRDFHITDYGWMALAIDVYGDEMIQKLINFIDEVHYEVGNDLHDGNIGFRENGQPVILDFAGFNN